MTATVTFAGKKIAALVIDGAKLFEEVAKEAVSEMNKQGLARRLER